jgi:iron(III) transport system ATP-binding protein
VGTPVEIYREPRSLFVARFVGQMNLLPARADTRPGWARIGNVAVRYEGTDPAPAGTPLTLAIRPEELVIGPAARQGDNALTARVRSVQFLGAFTRLGLALPGDDAVLECDVAAGALADVGAKEGSELPLALPAAALRAFRE